MEDRVRAALSVRLTPAADPEPEALIETPGLRILFVHVDFADAAGFDGVTQQQPADAFAPLLRCDEEHFQLVPGDSHKSDGFVRAVYGRRQNRNFTEGGGDILRDPPDFGFRQEPVSGPDRPFPDVQQPAEQGSVPLFYFDDSHDGRLSCCGREYTLPRTGLQPEFREFPRGNHGFALPALTSALSPHILPIISYGGFQMKVRPISPADLDAWTALRHELWPRHSPDDLRRESVELFRRSDTAFFCVEERGEWLGIAEASLRSPARGHLEGWYVKPEYRRRGVGRALVGAVEAWCISRGCTVLGSDTDGDYPVSPAAHRALGFREDGSPLLFRKELGTCANTPRLETERLILRRFSEADVDDLYALLRDPDVNRFLPWFPTETREEAAAFLHERFLDTCSLPSAYRYAVCRKTDDRPIGYVRLAADDSRDFGYGLRKEFWRQGIVTEAARAVVFRLRQDGVPYITATHDVNNPASGEVMKKIGMTYRYSYEELWQPKNIPVVFRMYQLNFSREDGWTYRKYWDRCEHHFIEELPSR